VGGGSQSPRPGGPFFTVFEGGALAPPSCKSPHGGGPYSLLRPLAAVIALRNVEYPEGKPRHCRSLPTLGGIADDFNPMRIRNF
jgi:hypothetical protein